LQFRWQHVPKIWNCTNRIHTKILNDLGRYNVTKNEADKYVYKVPSLRNVTRTYPYFHDGKVWDLREAVKIMGETQLGIHLNKRRD